MARSRRKAREAALRALYELEIGKLPLRTVLKETLENADLPSDLAKYAEHLISGVREHQAEIDDRLAAIVLEYDFDRIAAVDRNVLRVAAFELLHDPAIPPAVTINEAIEISRRYSTAESGKFVNGILGRLLQDSPKANWDPALAPPEEGDEEQPEPEQVEVEEVTVEAGSEEEKMARIGAWKLRSEPKEP